jgi:hypothetical protein
MMAKTRQCARSPLRKKWNKSGTALISRKKGGTKVEQREMTKWPKPKSEGRRKRGEIRHGCIGNGKLESDPLMARIRPWAKQISCSDAEARRSAVMPGTQFLRGVAG